MLILVDRPNTSIRHNSPLEININQISTLFLTAFSIQKPGFCDRECVLECTENIRFISQEYTQKLGFSFPLQISLVRLAPRLRQQRSTCRLRSLLNSWSYHIPDGDLIVSKTYMTRVEKENTRQRHSASSTASQDTVLLQIRRTSETLN